MSKTKKDTIQRKDWKFVNADPDPDFDADHNKRVIAKTIKKNEAYRRKKKRAYKEKVDERAEAISTYIQSLKQGGRESDINKYFGRREMARLRGEEIMNKLNKLKKNGKAGKQIIYN